MTTEALPMNSLMDGLRTAFPDLPDPGTLIQSCVRLLAAAALGAIVGWQREWMNKPAGIRTHMLVALGAAAFIVGGQRAGFDQSAISRVVQGLLAGVGFIGAGAILRRGGRHVEGLTTAASVWVAAAVGTAAGLGSAWTALVTAALGVAILGLAAGSKDGAPAAKK
jgi:putative Mg2+ transporter-C (MgtC) family protein